MTDWSLFFALGLFGALAAYVNHIDGTIMTNSFCILLIC
jgi:hypothetical protein